MSNFCGAVRRAAIAGMCYLNSFLQTGNRFSVETSGRLKAALSETGLERDSASLTETEKSRALLEHFFQKKRGFTGFTVYTKVKKLTEEGSI